ncbi:MAG: zinc-dependent alcohol dehydrogenase family protein [Desulfobacterales bacterium]|nr:zinc-dependent alcohol dehydrogenase family protein [Desulfobacterales bacterium]
MPKIVRFHKTGGPEVLQFDELPLVEPGEGEVRLKVEALGLNRAEVQFRMGLYLERPHLPARIGYEAAGIVDAIGPGVEGFKTGDRVSTIPGFSQNKYGVYGESAVVPAAAVAHYPDNLSAAEGAAIWMQYMTAYGALIELGGLSRGEPVLVTAASSSVGLAAIQIAKRVGAVAIATTRGPGKKESLLAAGADHVVVTDQENISQRTETITDGRGVRLIFDAVGGPQVEKLAKAAGMGATIFIYGLLSMEQTPFPLGQALAKGLSLRGYTLFEISGHPDKLARAKQFIYEGLQAGALTPIIDRTFPLDQIAEAHRYMESNQQVGKIVVTV